MMRCSRTERSRSRCFERKLILSTSSRYGLVEFSSLRAPPTPPRFCSSSVVMPAMMASLRVRSSTVWSCPRSDSTDLLNCSFALCSSRFSCCSFESSCVWDREVKYWTEKKADRQRDEVTSERTEKSRRWDTFNLRNLARACGTKMIVEYRLSICWLLSNRTESDETDRGLVDGYSMDREGRVNEKSA